mgnify:CR=1 FL=1
MTQWQICVDLVTVPASDFLGFDVAGLNEVRQNPLRRALCDSYSGRHFPHGQIRLRADRQQDVAVVREKGPIGRHARIIRH